MTASNRCAVTYRFRGFVAGKGSQDTRFLLRKIQAFTACDGTVAIQPLKALKAVDESAGEKAKKRMPRFLFAHSFPS